MLLTAQFAFATQGFPVAVVYSGIKISPRMIGAPLEWGSHSRARLGYGGKQIECLTDDCQLHVALPGLAAGITQWEIHMQVTGNAAVLNDVDGRADDDRRYAIGFKMPCYQTHGLVTDGSQRHQQCQINLVLLAHLQDTRSIRFTGITLAVLCRNTIKPGSELPHNSLRGELL